MKIIIRIDDDDKDKIEFINSKLGSNEVVIPQGDHIRVYVVSDIGEVTELK